MKTPLFTDCRTLALALARRLTMALTLLAGSAASGENEAELSMRELHRFDAAEAVQAVAVDAEAFYAIASRAIARHDKFSGERLALWKAPQGSSILHLNSGIVLDGRLYCANSNWPKKPLKNSVEIFDAATLEHLERKTFTESEGAINWIERHRGSWWIVFAFYADEVRRTRLVRYDDDWQSTGEWTFPESVIERFAPNSNSGGAFGPNGRLYVTGHDHAELYVLEVPEENSGELRQLTTVPAPIAGQGIAWDRSDIGTLYGIIRKDRQVVAMRLSHPREFTALKKPVRWIRDANNPVLPPRGEQDANHFDATRCMNPWVLRSGDRYRLFYSGGDAKGRQRIGVATAPVDDLTQWTREGPLFENGATGSFDARWCVLPHVVPANNQRWHLYYTGNAGRGSGLSAFPGIGLARSSDDGFSWTRNDDEPVLARSGEQGDPDAIGIAGGSVIQLRGADGSVEWRFYYTGCPTTGKAHALNQQKTICLAVSTDGTSWTKHGAVMLRDPQRDYEDIGVAGPVVLRDEDGADGGLFRMWYSAIGTRWGFYSICYAESDDGIHWRRGAEAGDNLQLTPDGDGWEQQMVEYPTVIREGERLRLFYCGNGYGRSGIGTALSEAAEP